MKISVFGTGYVGLVAGACFAENGNQVVCVDIDTKKISELSQNIIPIFEPGLEEIIKRNQQAGRLRFTTDAQSAVQESLFQFIAVGTPQGEDGQADLRNVVQVAKTIATHMTDEKIIVNKSTVPVGSTLQVQELIQKIQINSKKSISFSVVSNPEFLREGNAINDFMNPDRIIIGSLSSQATKLMKELYSPFVSSEDKILLMSPQDAEFSKYISNAMLALRISFMNEMANLCETVGANIEQIKLGVGSDTRIGPHFLNAGIGYGGSCFPKDVEALIHLGKQTSTRTDILEAIKIINQKQKEVLIKKIKKYFKNDTLKAKKIAVWGASFKPQTDDLREAPSETLITKLLQESTQIFLNDPATIEASQKKWKNKVNFSHSPYEILKNADALLILTEWNEYKRPDFEKMKHYMKTPLIFDGRNIYHPDRMRERGFHYISIGRPDVV